MTEIPAFTVLATIGRMRYRACRCPFGQRNAREHSKYCHFPALSLLYDILDKNLHKMRYLHSILYTAALGREHSINSSFSLLNVVKETFLLPEELSEVYQISTTIQEIRSPLFFRGALLTRQEIDERDQMKIGIDVLLKIIADRQELTKVILAF